MHEVVTMIALHLTEALLVGIFVLLVVAAHAAFVTRDARRRGAAAQSCDLRYPREWRIPAAAIGAVLVLAALLVSGQGKAYESAARVILALFGAGAMIEAYLTRVRVLPEGVERRTAWRAPSFVAWSDVAAVDLRLDLGWLALRTRSGGQLRIAKRLDGMKSFAACALIHLPREALAGDPVARGWLEERARGGAR